MTQPEPRTAQDVLDDLRALCDVTDQKQPAYRYISTRVIRDAIDHGRKQ